MNPVARLLIAVIGGSVLGWWLLVGFCSISGLKFSVACGHNAYIWLPLFIPLGIYVCWFLLGLISGGASNTITTKKAGGKNA